EALTARLRARWAKAPPRKPILLLTQGDPMAERGIAAITRAVADALSVPRGLVYLDRTLDPHHWRDADRYKIAMELPYTLLASSLDAERPGTLKRLDQAIETALREKAAQRQSLRKPPLPAYFHRYARLQEVTKAAAKLLCNEITVAHSIASPHPFSVASFYRVGLELQLIGEADLLAP
ncbi:MAG: shikimate kinase, partial [Pseudomonadales bacterium]